VSNEPVIIQSRSIETWILVRVCYRAGRVVASSTSSLDGAFAPTFHPLSSFFLPSFFFHNVQGYRHICFIALRCSCRCRADCVCLPQRLRLFELTKLLASVAHYMAQQLYSYEDQHISAEIELGSFRCLANFVFVSSRLYMQPRVSASMYVPELRCQVLF